MKKFKMTHLVFKEKEPIEFTEDNSPSWLLTTEFKWWWYEFILKLEIGESINSDFQKIERIA